MTCASQCDSGWAAVGWASWLKEEAAVMPLVFPERLISCRESQFGLEPKCTHAHTQTCMRMHTHTHARMHAQTARVMHNLDDLSVNILLEIIVIFWQFFLFFKYIFIYGNNKTTLEALKILCLSVARASIKEKKSAFWNAQNCARKCKLSCTTSREENWNVEARIYRERECSWSISYILYF